MQKGFAPIFLVILVLIVAILGGLFYFKPWQKNSLFEKSSQQSSKAAIDENAYSVVSDVLRTKTGVISAGKDSLIQLIDDRGVVITIKIAAKTFSKDQAYIVRPLKSDSASDIASGVEFLPAKLNLSQNAEVTFDFSHSKITTLGEIDKRSIFLLDETKKPIPLLTTSLFPTSTILNAKMTKTGVVIADFSGKKQQAAAKKAFTDKNIGTFSIIESAKIRANYAEKLNAEDRKKYDDSVEKITAKKPTQLLALATIVGLKKKSLSYQGIVRPAYAEDDLEKQLKDDLLKTCYSKKEKLSDYVFGSQTAKSLGDNQLASDCNRMAEEQAIVRVDNFIISGTDFEQGLTLFAELRSALPDRNDLSDRIFEKLKDIARKDLQTSLNQDIFTLSQMFNFVLHAQFMGIEQTLIDKVLERMKTKLVADFNALGKTKCPAEAEVDYLIEQARYLHFTDLESDFKSKRAAVIKCDDDSKLPGSRRYDGDPPPPPTKKDVSVKSSDEDGTTIYLNSSMIHYSDAEGVENIREECYDEYSNKPDAYDPIHTWCCKVSFWDTRQDMPLCAATSPQAYGVSQSKRGEGSEELNKHDTEDPEIEPFIDPVSDDPPLEPLPPEDNHTYDTGDPGLSL